MKLIHPLEAEVVEQKQEVLVPLQLHETLIETRLNQLNGVLYVDRIDVHAIDGRQASRFILPYVHSHKLYAVVHSPQIVRNIQCLLQHSEFVSQVCLADWHFEGLP